jgi:hypothetical protein
LHGVEVDPAFLADRMNRHDILMAEMGGRQRLILETLQLSRVERGWKGQDFQGHAPPQGNLLGFVNHSHATATDLAQQPEITQLSQVRGGIGDHPGLRVAFDRALEGGSQSLHLIEAGKKFLQIGADVGVGRKELAAVGRLTGFPGFKVCEQGFI